MKTFGRKFKFCVQGLRDPPTDGGLKNAKIMKTNKI